MALEVDLVARAPVVLAPEEVVEPHLVERGRAGVGGQVAADGLGADVGPDHHHRRVPADEGPDPALEVLVAGEVRLLVGGDGVDVGGRDGGREVHLLLAGPLEDPHQQVAGPGPPVDVDHVVEGVQPLGRLDGIAVRQAGGSLRRTARSHASTARADRGRSESTAGSPDGAVRPRPTSERACCPDEHSLRPDRRAGDRRLHRRLVPGEPRSRRMGLGGGRRPVGQRG